MATKQEFLKGNYNNIIALIIYGDACKLSKVYGHRKGAYIPLIRGVPWYVYKAPA